MQDRGGDRGLERQRALEIHTEFVGSIIMVQLAGEKRLSRLIRCSTTVNYNTQEMQTLLKVTINKNKVINTRRFLVERPEEDWLSIWQPSGSFHNPKTLQ